MRLATPLAIAALAAALLAGCGSSSSSPAGSTSTGSTAAPKAKAPSAPAGASAQSCDSGAVDAEALRATDVSCGEARRLMYRWQRDPGCAGPKGASRSACTTGTYRCLSTKTARGTAVSCAKPGRSVAFIARRG